MTFAELNKLIVAIRAHKISYDFFARTIKMIIAPEYGVNELVKGKIFEFVFNDCIYLKTVNTSKFSSSFQTEFISWGKSEESFEAKMFIEDFLRTTISAPFIDDFNLSRPISYENFHRYFFENTQGDALVIISRDVEVNEINKI